MYQRAKIVPKAAIAHTATVVVAIWLVNLLLALDSKLTDYMCCVQSTMRRLPPQQLTTPEPSTILNYHHR